MTMTVSQGEGMTVITVTSNPKSKWPVLCQILGSLRRSPVCFSSQGMKWKLKDVHTAIGIVQMLVGVLNTAVGIVFTCVGLYFNMFRISQGPCWPGYMLLITGIVCMLAAVFPFSCLLKIGMILNVVCSALAITVVLYSMDLVNDHTEYCKTSYYWGTPSPEDSKRKEICVYYKNINEIIFRGLDIMVVLSVLQLCVTAFFCVWTGKALCKKDEDEKSVEDPELLKPLLEDATAAPA